MNILVSSDEIIEPMVNVSPPKVVIIFTVSVLISVLIALILLPIENAVMKFIVIGFYSLVLLTLIRKLFQSNYLVTIRANKEGIYFRSDDEKNYYKVPWDNIGIIENTIYPLNKKGLRFEITGSYIEKMKNAQFAGEMRTENDGAFLYTIPQLNNRDRLIAKFLEFKHQIQVEIV